MKNTRNLVITNKESYLKPDEAVKIGHHIYKTYGIPTTIEIAGKNKLDLKIDLIQLDDVNYKSLKTDLETINIYIYKTTPKHNRRIRLQQKNDTRIAEEMMLNRKMNILNNESIKSLS